MIISNDPEIKNKAIVKQKIEDNLVLKGIFYIILAAVASYTLIEIFKVFAR